jgi:hypothetical protein
VQHTRPSQTASSESECARMNAAGLTCSWLALRASGFVTQFPTKAVPLTMAAKTHTPPCSIAASSRSREQMPGKTNTIRSTPGALDQQCSSATKLHGIRPALRAMPTAYSGHQMWRAWPNPSLNRTLYGGQRKPGPLHMVHHRAPGLRCPPPWAG